MNLGYFFARGLETGAQSRISFKRIEDFLHGERVSVRSETKNGRGPTICFQNASLSYLGDYGNTLGSNRSSGTARIDIESPNCEPDTLLSSLDCSIPSGKTTIILGAVGSGK